MIERLLVALLATAFTMAAHSADDPPWLKEARKRESSITDSRVFKSKDGWFTARVPAKVVGAIEKVEGSYSVELSIGADSSVYCEVVPDGIDLASMLQVTLANAVKQVESMQGKVSMRELEAIDAGAFDDVPYLHTSWVYLVDDGKEKRLGALKQLVFEKHGHGVYCAHADVGFTRSFHNLARSFAATFDATTKAAKPYYQEISVASVGNRDVGVSIVTLVRDEDGATEMQEKGAMLAPQGKGNVHAHDSIHKEWVNDDGSMINALHVIADDGTVTTNIELNPTDSAWIVEGQFQGKKVSLPLKAAPAPGTWLRQARELRTILAGEKPAGVTHSIPLWVEVDPSRLLDAKTRILAKGDAQNYSAVLELGPMSVDATLDGSGTVKAARMRLGPTAIEMKRIYSSGSFQ